jgi:hypothetical protein
MAGHGRDLGGDPSDGFRREGHRGKYSPGGSKITGP